MILLLQIPVADTLYVAHLSGQEVKTFLSKSEGREIDPAPRQCLNVKLIKGPFWIKGNPLQYITIKFYLLLYNYI